MLLLIFLMVLVTMVYGPIAALLVELFDCRFNPDREADGTGSEDQQSAIRDEIEAELASLDAVITRLISRDEPVILLFPCVRLVGAR